jgi:NH3-dependent NAD+ synthetase
MNKVVHIFIVTDGGSMGEHPAEVYQSSEDATKNLLQRALHRIADEYSDIASSMSEELFNKETETDTYELLVAINKLKQRIADTYHYSHSDMNQLMMVSSDHYMLSFSNGITYYGNIYNRALSIPED